MKAKAVTIEPISFPPGVMQGFPKGAYYCNLVVSFPDGSQVTQSTPMYDSEKIAYQDAQHMQVRLFTKEWKLQGADVNIERNIRELGY